MKLIIKVRPPNARGWCTATTLIAFYMVCMTWDAVLNKVSWSVITANWFNLALFIYMVLVTLALALIYWYRDKLTKDWPETRE